MQNAMLSFSGTPVQQRSQSGLLTQRVAPKSSRSAVVRVNAIRDGAQLDRPLRVAVIGGGPSGACAAETLAKGGVEAFMIERKMDNCKVRLFLSSNLSILRLRCLYPPTTTTGGGCLYDDSRAEQRQRPRIVHFRAMDISQYSMHQSSSSEELH